jgi:hypothetical protein
MADMAYNLDLEKFLVLENFLTKKGSLMQPASSTAGSKRERSGFTLDMRKFLLSNYPYANIPDTSRDLFGLRKIFCL